MISYSGKDGIPIGKGLCGPLTAARRGKGFDTPISGVCPPWASVRGLRREWAVDLFADDPVVFKKLVYERRFDEARALYGLFGRFYLGLQFRAEELGTLLEGRTPGFG